MSPVVPLSSGVTMSLPAIKICCIASLAEAQAAISAGASAVGLVSSMPSGPGVIPDSLIAAIAEGIGGAAESFLLTSRVEADAIIEQHQRCRTTTLQLVDHVPLPELRRLRTALPRIRLVQVIHVRDVESFGEALSAASMVDALLLDSGNPAAAIKELGGTGRTHDWALSRRIRDSVPRPVYLAGGLHAGNVADAVATVRPFGLDLCSGVRTDGRLDRVKLGAFFEAVRKVGT